MNKIKQNKITFILILSAIAIIFSSLTILSLPVLFNYKSKVAIIEKNFFKNFKIYLNSSGKITYKPFPKPHLLVENASLNLSNSKIKNDLINTSNLKIYISLRDIYLRSFENFLSTEILDSNLELEVSDLKILRNHLYQKINKPIVLNNCKIFLKNNKKEVILISPVKKITYKINDKKKVKNLIIDGEIFGLNFKSNWKRNYKSPKKSFNNINIYNPKIEIQNIFKFENDKKFQGKTQISYLQDKLEYNIQFDKNKIKINSPNLKNINFQLNSSIQLTPFFFEGELEIKKKKLEKIIDNFLSNLLLYNQDYLGNFNGNLKLKFADLKNKLIKKGEIKFFVNENILKLDKGKFELDKIGDLVTDIDFLKENGETKFISKNLLIIHNHIEFAKIFQVGSKKAKKINKIYFDLEKKIGDADFIIKNVKINNKKKIQSFNEIFIVKNIQNLRSHIRKVVD